MISVCGLIIYLAKVDGMVDGVIPLDGDGDGHKDAAGHGRLRKDTKQWVVNEDE